LFGNSFGNFFFTGCVGLHVFNSPNTLCLKAKEETNANVFVGNDHVEVQGAYSPKEHVGVFLNSYVAYPSVFSTYNSTGTIFGEGAVGYYSAFKKSSSDPWLFYDVYAGGGAGQRKYTGTTGYESTDNEQWVVSSAYDKAFIQASVYLIKGRSQLALAYQGAWIYFTALDSRMVDAGYGFNPDAYYSRNNFSVFNNNYSLTYKLRLFRKASIIWQVAYNRSNYTGSPILNNWTALHPYSNLPFDGRGPQLNMGFHFAF
jgi:hypothetical protein